jgi:IS5 family transposase
MDRNYFAYTHGDAINAILAAAGYNVSLLLNWLKTILSLMIVALNRRPKQLAA